MNFKIIREGARIGAHALRARIAGHQHYGSNAFDICRQIVEACWDDRGFFKTSIHNYPLFYARDFGMSIDSLILLGYRDKARRTLSFALKAYEREGRLTQQVNGSGQAFNFPDLEQPDALAFLLHSLSVLNDSELLHKHKDFLQREILRFATLVVDKSSGLLRRDLRVAGMRDYAIRKSSCYDNVMLAAIKKYAAELNLRNPLSQYNYKYLFMKLFWTGKYFKDDLENDEPTGDANIAPFWFRIFSGRREKELFESVQHVVEKLHLDKPVPLRYEPSRRTSTSMHWLDFLTGGWERDTAWLHLGNLYLQVLARLDPEKAKHALSSHRRLIEHHKCYPEVLDRNGNLHKSLFFHSDDSMLWAVNYLALSTCLYGES